VKPRIAITVGDPAGIGPEIARKAADDPRVREACEPIIYSAPDGSRFEPGVLSAEAGHAAYDAICAAVRDAMDGRVSAIATRLINSGWFRVGTERYAKESRTFGITTLRKKHVRVRAQKISFEFQGKHRSEIRTTLVDAELASSITELLALPGGARLFRYQWDGGRYALTGARLNHYVRTYLGDEFTAKDFRTWGGTLIAAVELAERGPAETVAAARRNIAAVMRRVGLQKRRTTSGLTLVRSAALAASFDLKGLYR